jgi:hypothetical protein
MAGQLHDAAPVTGTARRADVGVVRPGRHDIDGLILCAEHYGAPSTCSRQRSARQPHPPPRTITTLLTDPRTDNDTDAAPATSPARRYIQDPPL